MDQLENVKNAIFVPSTNPHPFYIEEAISIGIKYKHNFTISEFMEYSFNTIHMGQNSIFIMIFINIYYHLFMITMKHHL